MNREPIGVAIVGFGWMGQVHTRAYLRVPQLITVADPAIERFDDLIGRYQFTTRTTGGRT